jgi:predicted phage tail protein
MIWDFRLLVKSFGSYRLSWAVSVEDSPDILGVALVAAIATNGAALGLGTALRMDCAAMGISMWLVDCSDVSPQLPGWQKQSADNKPSYAFGSVTNTAQGYPVPLLYGKRRIGGAIISAGIYVEDQQ